MNKTSLFLSLAFISLGCDQGTNEVAPQNRTETSKGVEHGQIKSVHKVVAPEQAKASKGTAPSATASADAKASSQGAHEATFGPLKMSVPKDWVKETPKSSMRLAQYKADNAELIVFYFGKNGAGSTQANIDRWASQFKDKKSGGIASAKTEGKTFGKLKATTTYIEGSYAAGMGPMSKNNGGDQDDWAMSGAIVESSNGPYYFKLIGPKETVDAQKSRFDAFLESAKE